MPVNPRAVVETYFADLRRVRASGGATAERSSYGPLANLLNAVGRMLKPKVFCIGELADQGAGHPDFGLYVANQVQRGRRRPGQTPERGVVEMKGVENDAWLTADNDQVSRYWDRYQLVLVTNMRDFVLVGRDAEGRPVKLETFRLAEDAEQFLRRLETPRAHIAIAVTNGADYLVTWNFRHIANAVLRSRIEHVCRQAGYEPPVICTPNELMEPDHADATS